MKHVIAFDVSMGKSYMGGPSHAPNCKIDCFFRSLCFLLMKWSDF
ncbi:hypothetical protein OCE25_28460 [Bacillus cereus]|nr:hypothetical protein [Bacillus cereus]